MDPPRVTIDKNAARTSQECADLRRLSMGVSGHIRPQGARNRSASFGVAPQEEVQAAQEGWVLAGGRRPPDRLADV
jgi:hypothetical protein